MDSLIARVVAAAVTVAPVPGRGDDDTPYVPSGPVEIGTGGAHRDHPEVGSWQTLILMLIAAIVIGGVVLVYVVRQRGKLLERRRLRRMAEVARLTAAAGADALPASEAADGSETRAATPSTSPPSPPPHPTTAPGRPAPNA